MYLKYIFFHFILVLQMLMIEKQRIARRPEGEATFNVFYWLLGGAEGSLAKQLFLDAVTQNTNLFVTPIHKVAFWFDDS